MLKDSEQLSSMSFYDMVRHASTPEHDLSGIIDAFEEQAELIEENETDLEPLRDGIESLGKFDEDIRTEICSYLIDLVRSGALSPTDLPNLIRSISYAQSASIENLQKYQSSEAAITWSNFSLVFHDGIKKRDENGEFVYNVRHHFGHELGHSVLESGAINFEDVEEFFGSIPYDFETRHILNLREHDADPELIVKERFAELIGFYLEAKCSDNKFEAFLRLRAQAINMDAEDNFQSDQGKKFLEETKELFKFIDSDWENIRDSIDGNGFLLGEETDFEDGELPTEISTMPETVPEPPEKEIDLTAGDGASEGAPKSESPGNFPESADLGKKENHTENFSSSVNNLVKSLGSEFDIFGLS